jgi:hypothetical protein
LIVELKKARPDSERAFSFPNATPASESIRTKRLTVENPPEALELGAGGFEPPAKTPANTPDSETGGAKCGASGDDSRQTDPDLARIGAAWPTLPERVKGRIVGLIEAAEGGR